jgi:cytochrome c biogenesis factor
MLALVSDFGQFCMLFAFCLSCYAIVSSFLGGKLGNRRLVETAERAVMAVCGLVTLTVFSLWYQLLNDNFNLQFVAANSNRAMPWQIMLWGTEGRWFLVLDSGIFSSRSS